MHLLYIGYYTSDDLLYEIQNRGINNMSVARQKYETNLLTGIIEECGSNDIHLVSYVPVDNSFQIPDCSEICGKKVKHIPINRHDVKSMYKAQKEFVTYLNSLGEQVLTNLHVLMYEVNPIFLIPLLSIKQKYNIKLITLCAELSILRRSKRFKYQLRNKIFAYYERKFDGFILFAKPMEEVLKCQRKPHTVIEGIAPELFGSPKAKQKNIVMYAGGLGSDNNMKLLIEACTRVDDLDELWICGTGKDKEIVEQAATINTKIHYYGMISNDEVRKLEQEAKVLVNIRQPDAPITKYSFPSKLLEYIASGTLVLSTRLEGIPEEYFSYLLPLDKIDLESVTRRIQDVLSMDAVEYVKRSEEAQRFIKNYKSKNIQANKIINFVFSI